MIKLYWSPRSRSISAIWLLEETGLPYERVLTDITTGAQKAPEYLAINPMGKVPGLKDGDAALGEAAAICAYIADRYPETNLAPAGNRSTAREISAMAVLLAELHRAGADPALHQARSAGEHGGVGQCDADLRRARCRLAERAHGFSARNFPRPTSCSAPA